MTDNYFTVPQGQITFDAEGTEIRGRYYSRVPHVPGPWSGVTIGRGYDMGQRESSDARDDLVTAGVSDEVAMRLSGAAGLIGVSAIAYILDNRLDALEITPAQQRELFGRVYAELEADVIRICGKVDVVQRYGRTDWHNLHPKIRDVVVDLRYRGDYTPTTRRRVQPLIVANDLDGMRKLMAESAYWCSTHGVPRDRFKRRHDYLNHEGEI